jgi:hypothetical protein
MSECSCAFCDKELKKGCMSPDFCRACRSAPKDKNSKICPSCKSEYLAEYKECPNCKTASEE